jgi:hypothetical protein
MQFLFDELPDEEKRAYTKTVVASKKRKENVLDGLLTFQPSEEAKKRKSEETHTLPIIQQHEMNDQTNAETTKLVILSVTSYIFNPRYGSIVDVAVGNPHVVPLETLRESVDLEILLDLMYGEGWTMMADLRRYSSYLNHETDTLEIAADCGKVPKGLKKQFKKRIGEYIDSVYEGFPDDDDYDDDGVLENDRRILSGRIVGRIVVKK